MTGDQVRALRSEFPMSDVDALLGMENTTLAETLSAARIIYESNGKRGVHATRAGMVRELLSIRSRFIAMGPTDRAQIVVEDEERGT